jgi:GTP-binding protein
VLADIPGLIEGASDGLGLGHEFLAHVERCRLLVHVLEVAPVDGSDPLSNYATIEAELASHDQRLAVLPRIVVLSKADLVPADDAAATAAAWSDALDTEVLVTSSATGQGLDDLVGRIASSVPDAAPVLQVEEVAAEHRVYRPGESEGFSVEKIGDGEFRVLGRGIEILLARHDIENEEAMRYVEERLRQIGVIRSLEAAGFERGDDVEIGGVVFELDPGAPF